MTEGPSPRYDVGRGEIASGRRFREGLREAKRLATETEEESGGMGSDQASAATGRRFAMRHLWSGKTARNGVAVLGLLIATAAMVLAYATGAQSPGDFLDRLRLLAGAEAYRPNLRVGERLQARASRARATGRDSQAEVLEWEAAKAFIRAAAAAPGPREEMIANDGAVARYLELGWGYLARGRGRRFGLGRSADALRAAENVAACVVGVAPTRRRAEINAFIEELEEVLERALAGRCPDERP